ncbi:minor capsid protein [Alkalicoccobacillus porphyridii]|uniref:Capsid protein n=1 Tax=Alkalicoccobacillus porphyridii TaxID=2597270 RepID=A0A554A0A0_9BACI|nr:minor capsid protein [Alkalicoccobacillus porphyridii]TSB47127.1 capsid protein [Alkalicoccobacillus porphyridii]
MDFVDRLVDEVNEIVPHELELSTGYLGTEESFVVYPLPGSKTVEEYMDGTKDRELNFEFAIRSKDQQKASNTLWTVQNHLDELILLDSSDESFSFESIEITNTPFINNADDQGWFVFLLDIQAKITVIKEEATTNG